MTSYKPLLQALCGALLLASAGCSNTTSGDKAKSANADKSNTSNTQTAALEGVTASDAANVEDESSDFAKVINKQGTVANRGGYIKILVNKAPITNYEIQRRARFLKLRRVSGGNKAAEKELIDQALKLSESARLRTLASDEQVDAAYARFAKSNRITPAKLSSEMRKLGIGESHFKDFIRTQISWSRSLQRYSQAKNGSQSAERDVVTGLRKSGAEKPELTEYYFKRVVFVVPKSKRSASSLAARKREAQSFRQRFPGCEQADNDIKVLKDVSIMNERRVLEPEIPERWKEAVLKADTNGTTRILETPNGVEFMVICDKRQVNDDRAAVVAQKSEEFTDLNKKSTALEEEFLAQLRKNATIVYQ